jgi:NADH-ubiquinone oxidoreductase chain 2
MILVSMGFSFYLYVYNKKKDDSSEGVEREEEKLIDRDNSPIQLISQIKGYFYVNSFIAISLAITLFSFVGVPPIMGFFAKQMILSAALDSGYVFMTLIAILTSVIGAGYYLNLVKQIFFFKDNYKKNLSIANLNLTGYILPASLYNSKTIRSNLTQEKLTEFKPTNITIASSFSISISIITLLLILFIYIPGE